MSKNFTMNFQTYDTQRPGFEGVPVQMWNTTYSTKPPWHQNLSTLVMYRGGLPGDTFLVQGNAPANLSLAGLTRLAVVQGVDDGAGYIPCSFDFFFFGSNYSNASVAPGIYWNTNNVIGFGTSNGTITWAANTGRGILLGNTDRRTNGLWYSGTQTISNANIINMAYWGQNIYSDGVQSTLQWQMRLVRSPNNQYVEVRMSTVGATQGTWNLTNGTAFQNTFGSLSASAGAKGSSFVLRSDLNGSNWQLFYSYYLDL